MCSSSTASTTAPRALARSVSRMRAACSSAAAAALSDLSTCRDIWCRIVKKRPAPSSASTRVNTPAYHAVSCSRRRASGCITGTSSAEPVARAPQRRDQLRLEAVVDLAAQAAHEHLQHVGEGVVVVVPHVRGNGGAIEHAPLLDHEQLEQGKLLGAQRDRPTAAPHLAGAQIDLRSEERRVGKECRSRWSPYH